MNIIDKIKYISVYKNLFVSDVFYILWTTAHVCLRRFSNIILHITYIENAKRSFSDTVDYDFCICTVVIYNNSINTLLNIF